MPSVTENPAPSARPAPAGAPQSPPPNRIRAIVSNQQFLLFAALVALVAFFGIRAPSFLQGSEINNILNDFGELILLAAGETYVIIMGGIDLSVGANAGFSGVVGAIVMVHLAGAGVPEPLILLTGTILCAAVGLGVGLANAALMHWARLVPFVATLATLGALTGLSIVLTGGEPIGSNSTALALVSQKHFPISPTALVVIVITAVTWIWLHMTRYGRYTFAIGSSTFAARASGINVARHVSSVYALAGFLAGLTGMVFYMNIGSGAPTSGQGYELQAIAAVVIGGISLFGGSGRMTGAILGALIITVVASGLLQINVSPNWNPVAVAVCIAAAASLQALRPGNRSQS